MIMPSPPAGVQRRWCTPRPVAPASSTSPNRRHPPQQWKSFWRFPPIPSETLKSTFKSAACGCFCSNFASHLHPTFERFLYKSMGYKRFFSRRRFFSVSTICSTIYSLGHHNALSRPYFARKSCAGLKGPLRMAPGTDSTKSRSASLRRKLDLSIGRPNTRSHVT